MNSTMVTISWIVTGVFGLLMLLNLATSRHLNFPYMLGMLVFYSLVPGILWLIAYFTASTENNLQNKVNSSAGYNVSNQKLTSDAKDYSGGYNGGHNNSSSVNQNIDFSEANNNSKSTNKSDGYNSGDLYK